jgi:hypothetical protein
MDAPRATAQLRVVVIRWGLIDKISLLVGRKGSRVTELVYRRQLRPTVPDGAIVMDELFTPARHSHSDSHSAGRIDPTGAGAHRV